LLQVVVVVVVQVIVILAHRAAVQVVIENFQLKP
jgi:hypothetical protein